MRKSKESGCKNLFGVGKKNIGGGVFLGKFSQKNFWKKFGRNFLVKFGENFFVKIKKKKFWRAVFPGGPGAGGGRVVGDQWWESKK